MYTAIKECCAEKGYSVLAACDALNVSRSAYNNWLAGKIGVRTAKNIGIAERIEKIHHESTDKGYRRIKDDLKHDYGIKVNDKRVLRICRIKGIKSTIKYADNGCTRHVDNPQHTAENLLNRKFHADKPNEKWLTDVTEFKWYEGIIISECNSGPM